MNTTRANRHLERALELLQSTGGAAFGGTAFGGRPPGKRSSEEKKGPVKVLLKYTKDNKDALLDIAIDLAYDAGGTISEHGRNSIWHAEGHGDSPFVVMFHATNDRAQAGVSNAEVLKNNIPILQKAENIRVVAPGTNRKRRMADLIQSLGKVTIDTTKREHMDRIRFD